MQDRKMMGEEFEERYRDANLDTVCDMVKSSTMFHNYKQLMGSDTTQDSSTTYLAMISLICLKREDRLILNKVALDILFSMIDTKFRNELKE